MKIDWKPFLVSASYCIAFLIVGLFFPFALAYEKGKVWKDNVLKAQKIDEVAKV